MDSRVSYQVHEGVEARRQRHRLNCIYIMIICSLFPLLIWVLYDIYEKEIAARAHTGASIIYCILTIVHQGALFSLEREKSLPSFSENVMKAIPMYHRSSLISPICQKDITHAPNVWLHF
ncbi:hypothetical protein FKM82_012972 [Ascaphus truei]